MTPARAALIAALLLPGLAAAESDLLAAAGGRGRPLHIVRKSGAGPSAPAGFPNLVYYGGPVISNVTVYQVIWGSGTFLPGVAGGGAITTTKLGDFYRAATDSPYLDWLCEYDTPTQRIGRGGFAETITITPDPNHSGSMITDSQIQAELEAQIDAGILPHPDADTLFMIDFPLGVTIDDGFGDLSCVIYCGYHSTGVYGGRYYYYAVLPDFSAGSGCETGCGTNATQFNNVCATASHEMVEAITDAAVGQAPSFAPPLAWYDQTYGEIGDICNQGESSFVGSDGVTYVVQQEWSNQLGACIARKPNHPPVARCRDVTVSLFGCSAPASIDNGSSDPDCWDTTLQSSQSPAGPYPAGTTLATLTVTDGAGAFSTCSANVTVASTGCDDGNACTTGDACSGGVCAGTPGTPPAEVGNGVAIAGSGGSATITWSLAAGATSSDLVRGRARALPVGPGGADESCLAAGAAGTSIADASVPPLGDAFYYLVRGRNLCGAGPWGNEIKGGQPITRVTTTCP